MDLFVSFYQAVCFPICHIPKVPRGDYLLFDRRRLSYLNAIEKLNCEYCAYANGVLGYTVEIAARTEQYWCPIKHALRIRAMHSRYKNFFDYGTPSVTASRSKQSAGRLAMWSPSFFISPIRASASKRLKKP